MKKIIAVVLLANAALMIWAYFGRTQSTGKDLDIFCESTLKLDNDRDGTSFNFDGTIVTRFKPDHTGYIGLLGVIDLGGKIYNLKREARFSYKPKDKDGIYDIRIDTVIVAQADTAPTDIVERNIIGKPGIVNSYVIRHANNNTWSIGNIFTPIMMCVDKKN